ncbi:unnamed protein product, partial [Symbiodinium sp. KB8]
APGTQEPANSGQAFGSMAKQGSQSTTAAAASLLERLEAGSGAAASFERSPDPEDPGCGGHGDDLK